MELPPQGDVVAAAAAATPASILTSCLVLYLLQATLRWLTHRKRFADMGLKLPGEPLPTYGWLADLQAFAVTVNTVPGLPGIARAVQVLHNYAQRYRQAGLYRMFIFHPYRLLPIFRLSVSVQDHEMVRQLLSNPAYTQKLAKDPRTMSIAAPIFGTQSVLALNDGPRWKHQRKLLARGFGQEFLEYANQVAVQLLYEKVFVALNSQLMPGTTTSGGSCITMEMTEWSTRLTSEVLGIVAFSYSFGGLDGPQQTRRNNADVVSGNNNNNTPIGSSGTSLFSIYERLLWTIGKRLRAPPLVAQFRFAENIGFAKQLRILDDIVDKVVAERLAESTTSTNKKKRQHGDLLSYMMPSEEDDDSDRLTLQELRDNIKTLMFAGQDTTASTLAMAFWELSRHTDIQDKLRAEVDALFDTTPVRTHQDNNDDDDDQQEQKQQRHVIVPAYKEIMNLKYLDSVVKETLRLYAPAPVARRAIQDVTLQYSKTNTSYTIPAGSTIVCLPCVANQTSAEEEDAAGLGEWNPERWTNNGNDGQRDPVSSYFPFSVGPRNCVGQPLALAELKIMLAHTLRHYTLEPTSNAATPILTILMTVKPHQVLVDMRRRSITKDY